MAIKKCKECGKEVSTKADLCPHCGAKQKRKSIGCGGAILILIVIGFVGSQFADYNKKAEERKQVIHREQVRKSQDEKNQKAKVAFEKGIEQHYTELVKLADGKQINEALSKVALFKKYGKLNYKDVEKYNKLLKKQSLIQRVKKLPASDIQGNLKSYQELLALEPNNDTFRKKINYYQGKWDKHLKEKQKKEYRASCQLEVVSSSWSENYGYSTYEGQVKNISNLKLDNVQAVVTWYDRNGNMITSSSALIEYNPILPGQISPFKVMKTYNPAMEKAGVEFSKLMGGTLRVYRKK